jgi:small subunit ribosomal protein S6
MRNYEIMYIVRPNLQEEGRKALIESFSNVFTNMGSEVAEVKEWGMRDLAYPIEDFTKGYYVVMNVNSSNEARDEFDRLVKISEDIIRHIVVRQEA